MGRGGVVLSLLSIRVLVDDRHEMDRRRRHARCEGWTETPQQCKRVSMAWLMGRWQMERRRMEMEQKSGKKDVKNARKERNTPSIEPLLLRGQVDAWEEWEKKNLEAWTAWKPTRGATKLKEAERCSCSRPVGPPRSHRPVSLQWVLGPSPGCRAWPGVPSPPEAVTRRPGDFFFLPCLGDARAWFLAQTTRHAGWRACGRSTKPKRHARVYVRRYLRGQLDSVVRTAASLRREAMACLEQNVETRPSTSHPLESPLPFQLRRSSADQRHPQDRRLPGTVLTVFLKKRMSQFPDCRFATARCLSSR